MIEAAGTLITRNDGRVLILQRPTGEWDLPKGRVKDNESLISAALRETREEIGAEPTCTGNLAVDSFEDIEFWIFEATVIGNIHISEEHIGYDWVSVSEAVDRLSRPLDAIVSRLAESS